MPSRLRVRTAVVSLAGTSIELHPAIARGYERLRRQSRRERVDRV